MKRVFAGLFVILILISTVSCNGDDHNKNGSSNITVMSYKNESISSGLYGFIFSYNKSSYLYLMQNYDGMAYAEDTESFWNSYTEDGLTLGEGVVKDINDHCKMIMISASMAEEYGVSLSEDNIDAAEAELNDLIAVFGSEKKFNDYLKKFGLNADDILEYLKKKHLVVVLQEKLCSSGGICEVNDAMLFEHAENIYVKIKHIYFSNDKNDGKAYDKLCLMATDINNSVSKFDDYTEKSEDTFIESNPKGALAEKNTLNEEYLKCVQKLKNGEVGVAKLEDGAYLIQRLEIDESDIEENFEMLYSDVADSAFSEHISSYYNGVEISKEELAKYDIITAETYELS